MDVNCINRNSEYLKNYSNISDVSQSSNVNFKEENLDSNNKVQQISKEDKEKKEYTKQDLDKAIGKLNKFLEDDRTHAEYERHKDLGTIMVRVIDDDTDDIILEAPPKKILDMVASMCKQVGLLDKKA